MEPTTDNRFVFRLNDETVWLQPLDAFLTTALAKSLSNASRRRFLEIGVFKGGWIRTLLENCPDWSGIAVDPFPNAISVKNQFLEMLVRNQLDNRVVYFPHLPQLERKKENKFDVIHIDGEHSEDATFGDLQFAFSHLSQTGMIICDDIYHREFPGVLSAVFAFIHSHDIAPFMMTSNKIFLCRPLEYESFHANSLKILQQARLDFSLGFDHRNEKMGIPVTYTQSNAIKSFQQIIVPPPSINFIRIIQGKKLLTESQLKMRASARKLVPPLIWEFAHIKRLQRVFSSLKSV